MTITDEADRIADDVGRALARVAVDRVLRPVWYALVAYGGMWLGGVDFDQDGTPVPRLAFADTEEPAWEDLRAS